MKFALGELIGMMHWIWQKNMAKVLLLLVHMLETSNRLQIAYAF